MSNSSFACELQIEGMHCAACELTIEKNVSKLAGVKKVNAVLSENVVKLKLAAGTDIESLKQDINEALKETDYRVVDSLAWNAVSLTQLLTALLISLLIVAAFLVLQRLGITNSVTSDQLNLSAVFVIGLVASLSSCMAVVGGLVLTISSSYAQLNSGKAKPLLAFHISRLVAFFLLGGVIGLLGAAFTLSPIAIFVINLILFVVMVIMGLNMLGVFPFLKKFELHLPKSLGAKGLDAITSAGSMLAATLLGIVSFFLPCGFTQSMQVFALTTGSFIDGALTMFVFALGTLPALALISFASVKFSKGLNSGLFFKTAGFLILFFALFNFLGALAVVGIIPPLFNI